MSLYTAAIDQGTTSTRCMLFDRRGEVAAAHQREHQQIFPRPGWVEHNPVEIWQRTQEVVVGALREAGVAPREIAAVGIANQRETTLVWNRHTGRPYHNAIVWQDTRTDALCAALSEHGGQDRFRAQTGLPLTTYFSGPMVVVCGPLAKAIGMNSQGNALGQGNRANATIGRALQLVIRNVGGGRPQGVDRATLVRNYPAAVAALRRQADWVLQRRGGDGALRELSDALLASRGELDALHRHGWREGND